MTTRITRLFTEHPESVDETYFQHMAFAGRFSFKLFVQPSPHSFMQFCHFVREDCEHNRSPAL